MTLGCGGYHLDDVRSVPSLCSPLSQVPETSEAGAHQRPTSKREPTLKACVTTAVIASPVPMRANGHQAPLF